MLHEQVRAQDRCLRLLRVSWRTSAMKRRQKLLSDVQRTSIEPLLTEQILRWDRRRRPWASSRACIEGIFGIPHTGAAGRSLPDEFPPPSTCQRRLKQWEDEGIWLAARRAPLGALDAEGLPQRDEAFLEGSFALAKSH